MDGAPLEVTMQDVFLWGVLCHAPLRRIVLGRDVPVRDAVLPGHAVRADGNGWPVLAAAGTEAGGLLATDLCADEVARLTFYWGGAGPVAAKVRVAGKQQPALTFGAGAAAGGPDWHLADWGRVWGETATLAAADAMALMGTKPAAEVRARQAQRLTRAGASLRAARQPSPTGLRRHAAPGDVKVTARSEPYARFFAVEEYDLTFRRFDGSTSASVNRAVFVSGDAAVVLPYDPVRDRVMVIEQFRPGPFGRGDPQPWLVEAIAGRIDGGETPEDAARREAREEAGLELAGLVPVADYYPTPGAKAEYLYSWIGLADLPDGAAGVGGVADEHEDIRVHVIPFARLKALVASGEVNNAPLLILAMWLERHRETLREGRMPG